MIYTLKIMSGKEKVYRYRWTYYYGTGIHPSHISALGISLKAAKQTICDEFDKFYETNKISEINKKGDIISIKTKTEQQRDQKMLYIEITDCFDNNHKFKNWINNTKPDIIVEQKNQQDDIHVKYSDSVLYRW